MRIAFLIFIVSAGSLSLWPQLPSIIFFLASSALLVCLCLCAYRKWLPRFWLHLALAAWLGCAWGALRGELMMGSLLPAQCSHQTFGVTGRVVALPSHTTLRNEVVARFALQALVFDADSLARCKALSRLVGETVQLSWYGASHEVIPNQVWHFDAKLERPRGQSNPSGADYQLWLMRQGITAKGTVRSGELVAADHLVAAGQSIDSLRYLWRKSLVLGQTNPALSGLIAALTIGDARSLPVEIKALLQRTGTSHLMAISGLHIGIVALFGYWLGRLFGGFLMLVSRGQRFSFNARFVASIFSLLIAFTYSALSGFALPTQRAVVMVALFHLSRWVAKHWSLFDVWLYALLLVILLDPIQTADAGLYLSFGAVLVLIVSISCRKLSTKHYPAVALFWLRPQVVIFIGLMPLSVYLFGGLSLIAVLTNSIAIPWVTLTTVPLSLVSFLLWIINPKTAEPLLLATEFSADILLTVLFAIDAWMGELSWLKVSMPPAILWVFCAGAVLFLLPSTWRFRGGVVALMGLVFYVHISLKSVLYAKERRLTVFDVGQGLAVLIEADGQTLLYDTGPPLGEHTDAFQQNIAPYLRARGISFLDYLVISHNDADHAGGLTSVLAQLEVSQIYAGDVTGLHQWSFPTGGSVTSCHLVQKSQMLGVDGHFSFDGRGAASTGNDASCVLMVHFPELALFLPGDISRARELRLLPLIKPAHASMNLVIAPHHGSNSSSSYGLLQQLSPGIVIASAGFMSRYGHPHAEMVARAKLLGFELLNTANTGAVQFRWQPGAPVSTYRWRETEKHFWFDG